MSVWPRTLKKLQTLVDDIHAVYGYDAISHDELADIIFMAPEDYPCINTVKNKGALYMGAGYYIVRMPDVIEKEEPNKLPKAIRNNAANLVKHLFS